MFAFQFHIRDYIAKTRHLSLLEDLAYRRLIDAYYTEEGPLPPDVQACARLIAMREHATEVESVLREFFVLTDAGWTNDRCDYEISKYRALQDSARKASSLRWKNRESGPHQDPDANASGPHTEPDQDRNADGMPTRKPNNPSTSKPKKSNKPPVPKIEFDWANGCFQNITDLHRRNWSTAYPDVDIDRELALAATWIVDNPDKPRTNLGQFLKNWMSRNGAVSNPVPQSSAVQVAPNPFEGLA